MISRFLTNSHMLPRAISISLCSFRAFSAFVLAATAVAPSLATCPANSGMSPTPTADFAINGDSTVTHRTTNLIWKQCYEGQSGASCATGTAGEFTWSNALSAAKNSSFAGFTDWRVPSKQELESIVDDTCSNPAINVGVFPGVSVSTFSWTSTTFVNQTDLAWGVDFTPGYPDGRKKADGSFGAVRLVRGGQSFDGLNPSPPAPAAVAAAVPSLSILALAILSLLVAGIAGARAGRS